MFKNKITIMYLGHKAAGPGLAYAWAHIFSKDSKLSGCILSKENTLKSLFDIFKTDYWDIPTNMVGMLNIGMLYAFFRKICRLSPDTDIFIPMHHPLSVLAMPFLSARKIPVHSVIHDVRPHSGGKSLITKLANIIIVKFSTSVICHSQNQYDLALKYYPEYSDKMALIEHPPFHHFSRITPDEELNTKLINERKNKVSICFFGRLEFYKGLHRLQMLHEGLVAAGIRDDVTLWLFGSGELGKLDADIFDVCLNRYISEEEILAIFTNTDYLLLPYTEGTQSGILYISQVVNPDMVSLASPIPTFLEIANETLLVADTTSDESYIDLIIETTKNHLSSVDEKV